jgi:hypothetical protein
MIESIARAAGDEEWKDRVRAARDAVKYLATSGQGAGLPTMTELLGNDAARKVAEWLGYQERYWTFRGYRGPQATQPKPAPVEEPEPAPEPKPKPAAQPAQPGSPEPPPWPELRKEALHGLAGDIVKTIGPETESDPVAILIQTLVYFGNAIGRGPYFLVESSRHYTNMFAIIAGESSKSRKGTAADRVREVLEVADPDWATHRITGGLSSGEGLIWAVRDPIIKIKNGEEEVDDPGVTDKRFLASESEYFSILAKMKQEGNILSRVLRDAFDGRHILQTLTKHSPAKATNAHISVCGRESRLSDYSGARRPNREGHEQGEDDRADDPNGRGQGSLGVRLPGAVRRAARNIRSHHRARRSPHAAPVHALCSARRPRAGRRRALAGRIGGLGILRGQCASHLRRRSRQSGC